ncbi:hypothetical protein BDV26DRAFT_273442 [Aspergillus bertholletiae]|uniref:Uncharacterized protein n=1 Tax=Aspergillus bertholletiae TaxID=1226010 RepID=A0A5N7ATZ2_9EURO|nr:hypothetical protein BDV26DRAFT_273442 [Aspergillus bertholletiae]
MSLPMHGTDRREEAGAAIFALAYSVSTSIMTAHQFFLKIGSGTFFTHMTGRAYAGVVVSHFVAVCLGAS